MSSLTQQGVVQKGADAHSAGSSSVFFEEMSQVCDLEFDSDLSTARLDKMKLPKFFDSRELSDQLEGL